MKPWEAIFNPKGSEAPYRPNREERRAAEQKRARQQRKGQRAYNRTVRPQD